MYLCKIIRLHGSDDVQYLEREKGLRDKAVFQNDMVEKNTLQTV